MPQSPPMTTTDLQPGTIVKAERLIIALPRQTKLDPVIYTVRDCVGVILPRDCRRVVDWTPHGSPVFEQIGPLPTMDACGYYWVQPRPVSSIDKPTPIKIRHDELEVVA